MISKLWHLSRKMLLVKKGRTLFSISAIALSVGLLCSIFQLHSLFNQDLQQRSDSEYGSAQIRISSPTPTDAPEWSGLDISMLGEISDLKEIQSIGLALEGKLAGSIIYKNQSEIIVDTEFHYVGVDNEHVTKEYYSFSEDLAAFEVAISKTLADKWQVDVADSIEIDLQSGQTVSWKVAEVVQSKQMAKMPTENWAFFHLASLQEVIGLPETINPVLIELADGANVNIVGSELIGLLPHDVRVEALQGLEEEVEQYTFLRVYGYVASVIAFIASIILVYGMMQTTYRERLGELAVIRAVGGSPEQLMRMVIYEWTIIGAIGSVVGFTFTWLLSDQIIMLASKLFTFDLIVESGSSGMIGMIIIALFAWIVIVFASLGIVRKVSQTEPVESFRDSLASVKSHNGKNITWIICVVTGLLFWFAGSFLSETSMSQLYYKALFTMLGGLLFIIALFNRLVPLSVFVLRGIMLLPTKLVSRIFRLSAERLMVEKSQLFPVILLALVITIYIPVATLFQSLEPTSFAKNTDRFEADYVVKAEQAFVNSYNIPWYVKQEVEEIEGVTDVLALPVTQFAELTSDHPLYATNFEENYHLRYGVTDLMILAEWGVVDFPDETVTDAAILPWDVANELGVEIGDTFPFVVDGVATSVVIIDLIDQLAELPYYHEMLLIHVGHSDIQPSSLNEIFVKTEPGYGEHISKTFKLLEREYPEINWYAKTEVMHTFDTQIKQALFMLQGITIIIIIASIGGMINTLSAGIHARRREYAVLRAIYLTPKQMMKLVAWQGVILAVLSLITGTITAMILLASIHMSSSGFEGMLDNIPYGKIGLLYVILFGLAVLATIPMAGKIARMNIMEAFKKES